MKTKHTLFLLLLLLFLPLGRPDDPPIRHYPMPTPTVIPVYIPPPGNEEDYESHDERNVQSQPFIPGQPPVQQDMMHTQ